MWSLVVQGKFQWNQFQGMVGVGSKRHLLTKNGVFLQFNCEFINKLALKAFVMGANVIKLKVT
jgi:hypothetical protein